MRRVKRAVLDSAQLQLLRFEGIFETTVHIQLSYNQKYEFMLNEAADWQIAEMCMELGLPCNKFKLISYMEEAFVHGH